MTGPTGVLMVISIQVLYEYQVFNIEQHEAQAGKKETSVFNVFFVDEQNFRSARAYVILFSTNAIVTLIFKNALKN